MCFREWESGIQRIITFFSKHFNDERIVQRDIKVNSLRLVYDISESNCFFSIAG